MTIIFIISTVVNVNLNDMCSHMGGKNINLLLFKKKKDQGVPKE